MDYDDNDSEGHNRNLAGEESSKASPVLHPYTALPRFDFDDSLQGHLRFHNLVEDEVFLGLSSREENQWIEDFSRGTSDIEFTAGATESCSISRRNNVWSEATSSESVEMLLKSVGHEERIQGESIIKEPDAGNESVRLTTEMEPNLKQDGKSEDVNYSQPTALTDYFSDGRNVHALGSQEDNSPVCGSSSDIHSNVSSGVLASEADVGFDRKCCDTNKNEVDNLDESLVDNLKGFPSDIHVQNVNSFIASITELNGLESKHLVTDTSVKPVEGLLLSDIPQGIMEEQSIRSTESDMVDLVSGGTAGDTCTHNVENPQCLASHLESFVQCKVETTMTSSDELFKLPGKASYDLQMEEECKSDNVSVEPPQQCNVEVLGCNEVQETYKPLQDSLDDSSVTCLEDKNVEGRTLEVVNADVGNSDELFKLPGKASCDLQMEEECKSDNVSVEPPQQCNVEVLACDEGQETYKPLQDSLDDSSVTCLDDKNLEGRTLEVVNADVGNSACTEVDIIFIEEKKCCDIQVDRLETRQHIEVVNTKAESSSCKELFVDSIADEKIEKHKDRGPFAEASFFPDVDDKLAGRGKESGISNAGDPDMTVSSTLSGVLSEQHSSVEDPNNIKTPRFLEEDITPEAQTSPLVLGGHMPLSKNNISSEQDAVHSCEEDVPLHGSGNAKVPTESMCSDKFSKANILIPHGEFDKSTSIEPGAKAAEEVQLSLCDSPSGLPLLSGTKATADGVTLCNQGQKSQVTDLLGLSQVATDLEPVRLPESGQGTDTAILMEQAEAQGCSTKLEACSVLFDSTSKHVEGTGASMHKSEEEISMERNTEMVLHVAVDLADDSQASVALARPSNCIAECVNKDGIASANLVEKNPDRTSIISCPDTPPSENRQQLRIEEAPVDSVQHSEATPDSGGKVQSVFRMQHDDPKEEKSFTFEISSSTGLSEGETIKGWQSNTSGQGHKRLTDAKEYPLTSDCSQIVPPKVPENSYKSPQAPGFVLQKTRAGAKGTSVRKTRQASVKTSATETSEKRDCVQETTPVKQFEGASKSTMFLDCPGTGHLVQFEEFKSSGNVEQSGSNACGSLPIPISDLPDLNTLAPPAAYLQQPFTYLQQVQLRAQILVHGSLMQDSVPDEACMVSAFGPSDGGRNSWEPSWRACSERVHSQKSHSSNLETPSQSGSGSRDPDHPVKHSSLRSTIPSSAARSSSQGITSPLVNPNILLSSPLWDVSTTCESSGMPSGTFVDSHQPFAPLQPHPAAGIRSFVIQSPSWFTHSHFPGQWVAPQTYALDDSGCVPLIASTEAVKVTSPKVSYVPNHPAIKQASHLSVSTGVGGAIVSSEISSQTYVNKAIVLSGQQSVNTKPRKRKKVPATQAAPNVPATLLAQNLPKIGFPVVVNNILSTSNPATNPCFASTSSSHKYLGAVSPISLSDQPIGVNPVLENKSIISEDTLNEVETAKIQAENASAHAVAAVGNCHDVWSQLAQLKTSGIQSDVETKLSSAAMAIAAAASVAKAAAAAAKLASDVALEAKLMADEVTGNYSQSTGISLSRALDGSRDIASSPMVGEGKISASSIIAAAKERVKKRGEAASAASKHAENMDAKVKAAELAAEAVSQARKILSIGDHLLFRKLVDSGPLDYWRIPQLSSEQDAKSHIVDSDQPHTSIIEQLVPAEPPKVGETIMAEAVNSGTVTSTEKNSSRTQRASGTVRAVESNSRTISDVLISGDASKTASGTSLESGMAEGCIVEVSRDSGNCKEAWYLAKILNMKDGKAFVCYTELQAHEGKLKEWVPLKGDGIKAPRIRIAHPTTTTCFDGNKKRCRAAVMDYTWCVGDRVDAWMHDCWLEGVVKEKHKNDETTLTIFFPALRNTLPIRTWHLRPTVTWQDGKWTEWPSASGKSPTQGDAPQEKRAKLGHTAIEASDEDNISRAELVGSKEHEESRLLPLSANQREFNIGKNTTDNKLNVLRTVRSELQNEGSRVVFGVPKQGKKRNLKDVSKHLDSDQSSKSSKTSDSITFSKYLMHQGSGGSNWKNNTNVDIKEEKATENKPKILRSGKSQCASRRALPQKVNSLVSAKLSENATGSQENVYSQQDLMEFGSVSDSQDTSEGPSLVSSKGLPKVSHKKVPSSNAKSVSMSRGKLTAAGGQLGKKVELQDKFFSQVSELRRSNRKIQPTSRLLLGLQSSITIAEMPSARHDRFRRNQKHGNLKSDS